MIRLETSKANGIDNNQSEINRDSFIKNWTQWMQKEHPQATIRTSDSGLYNCHGMTFASRRTRIEKNSGIAKILSDDSYVEVSMADTLPGDVVIYYSDKGDPDHSGVVVELRADIRVPIICSKWGCAGEFIHTLADIPPMYGKTYRFFRCRL